MRKDWKIPFNKPHLTHKEMGYISHAHSLGQLSGDGFYTKKCHQWMEKNTKAKKVLLTSSCTAALEMMTTLINIKTGDEVIMPSFTFPSTANAVVLKGGIPVFVDIRPDTLNIDEKLLEEAITPKTKAIFVVHYAGVGCEMKAIKRIAKKNKLWLLEDAAQGILSSYNDQLLGTIGDLGAYSFHETKNIISGEGGALLINNQTFIERAEIIREKGTNRNQFFRGQVDKYTWVDIGSSYLPGEVIAAFLMAQLEQVKEITKRRIQIWNNYHKSLKELEQAGYLRRPIIPANVKHNGHLYFILLNDKTTRDNLLNYLHKKGIYATYHYIPLHSSPAGKKYGRFQKTLKVTNQAADTLIRLPLFYDITDNEISYITQSMRNFFK